MRLVGVGADKNEASHEVDALKKKIDALKAENSDLKAEIKKLKAEAKKGKAEKEKIQEVESSKAEDVEK